MKYSRILFAMTLFFLLISCQNGQREKKTKTPNESPIPSSEHNKKSSPENDRQRTIEEPVDQNLQKKKIRAIDTLKPVTTAP